MPLDPTKPIKQTYAAKNPDGSWLWGLDEEGFERVRLGYGCHNCREPFAIGGSPIQLATCPVCKTPQQWVDSVWTKPEDW